MEPPRNQVPVGYMTSDPKHVMTATFKINGTIRYMAIPFDKEFRFILNTATHDALQTSNVEAPAGMVTVIFC